MICSTINLVSENCRVQANSTIFTLGTYPMGSCISFLRYYSVQKASKTRLVKAKTMALFICFGTITSYSIIISEMNFNDINGYFSFLSLCDHEDLQRPKNPLVVIGILSYFTVIIIGLIYDVKLIIFVKKRGTQVQSEATLVPWKSSDESVSNDLQVPVRATVITIVIILILFGLAVFAKYLMHGIDDSEFHLWLQPIIMIPAAVFPVILVTLTVKQQDKLKVSQPPTALQFHDENIDDNTAYQPPSGLHFHDDDPELHI